MLIAVDFDGTFIDQPEKYTQVIQALRKADIVTGILTGRPPERNGNTEKILKKYGCRIDFFWDTAYFNRWEQEIADWIKREKISMERDVVVCMFKARMCFERGLTFLIDDAADRIRMFLDPDCKTIVLKHPNTENHIFPRWNNGILQYDDEGNKL